MMKKYIISTMMFLLACPQLDARSDGGAIAAGALGGLAIGTMLGSASANQSARASRAEQAAIRAQARAEQEAVRAQQAAQRAQNRAEQEALRAQEKVEQIRLEQGQQRIAALEREIERRNIENKIAKSRNNSTNTIHMMLIALLIVLVFSAAGLSIILFKKRP